MRSPRLVIGLLVLGFVEQARSSGSCSVPVVSLADNFRDVQPLNPLRRTIYRTSSATAECSSECSSESATCFGDGSSKTKRVIDTTIDRRWTYSDQLRWNDYTAAGTKVNECFADPEIGTLPGESPIDFQPSELTATDEATITLSEGFGVLRSGLAVTNDDHAVEVTVCGANSADCGAVANFGAWPKKLRGIADDDGNHDDYYLAEVRFHWGSDNTKGSEHQVCGDPKSAEMHMVFVNKNPERAATGRDNAESGLQFAVLGTLIEGGATEEHEGLAPVFSSVHDIEEQRHLTGSASGFLKAPLDLQAMLPADYDSKFFTYPGSLTTPPCSQQVSWFVFENVVRVTDAQLDMLRHAQTAAVGSQLTHSGYKAVLFPFVAIIIGTAIAWLLSRYAPSLPYTVAVLLMGMTFSALLNAFNPPCINCPTNSLVASTNMWAKIDGHLLLYAFLPALLFGDSMNLDVYNFQRNFSQCLVLACPGVLLGTFLTGWAAKAILPFEWDLTLCMAVGAILSATDPVAVVAMLKSLGANQNLTMQITGESLMNDGTAIVVFNIFWAMYNSTHEYMYEDFGTMLKYFCRLSIAGPLLGIAIGYVALFGMQLCTRKYSENDITIQTSITLCTAYLSFFMGESESTVSGVLCCVSSALVLAKHAWPIVNSHEALENVWAAIEYFGNSVLFFLAGVITQRAVVGYDDDTGLRAVVTFKTTDYFYVIAFYVVMMAIRAALVLASYPLLKVLGTGTTPKDAAFMVWAGLRGAVGLALALLVLQSGGDQRAGLQVVFLVSGLAFLTLIVNGITCGPLLQNWGMLGKPDEKKRMLEQVQKRVEDNSVKAYHNACDHHSHDAEDAIKYLTRLRGLRKDDNAKDPSKVAYLQGEGGGKPTNGYDDDDDDDDDDDNDDNSDSAEGRGAGGEGQSSSTRATRQSSSRSIEALHVEAFTLEDCRAAEEELRREGNLVEVDLGDLRAMRERFYRIVRSEYWELIEKGHLPRGSSATQLLLHSLDMALDAANVAAGGLEEAKSDWDFVLEALDSGCHGIVTKCMDRFLDAVDEWLPESVAVKSDELHYMINYTSVETCYHVCASFMDAHGAAQVKLATMFGDDPSIDTPQEVIIIRESLKKIELSANVVDEIQPGLIKIIKTKIVAEHLLEIEHSFVQALMTQGVVTMKEAEELFESIEDDSQLLSKARKAQARDLARAQAVVHLGLAKVPSEGFSESDLEAGSDPALRQHRFKGMKQSVSTEMLMVAADTSLSGNMRRGLTRHKSGGNLLGDTALSGPSAIGGESAGSEETRRRSRRRRTEGTIRVGLALDELVDLPGLPVPSPHPSAPLSPSPLFEGALVVEEATTKLRETNDFPSSESTQARQRNQTSSGCPQRSTILDKMPNINATSEQAGVGEEKLDQMMLEFRGTTSLHDTLGVFEEEDGGVSQSDGENDKNENNDGDGNDGDVTGMLPHVLSPKETVL